MPSAIRLHISDDFACVTRPETIRCNARRSPSPARLFSPSVRWWMPVKKIKISACSYIDDAKESARCD